MTICQLSPWKVKITLLATAIGGAGMLLMSSAGASPVSKMGRDLLQQSREDAARALLIVYSSRPPERTATWRELARWYSGRQQWREAAAAWRMVMSLGGRDSETQHEYQVAAARQPRVFDLPLVVELGSSSNNPLARSLPVTRLPGGDTRVGAPPRVKPPPPASRTTSTPPRAVAAPKSATTSAPASRANTVPLSARATPPPVPVARTASASAKLPAARAARVALLRARALTQAGADDLAGERLRTAVNLDPNSGEAWRALAAWSDRHARWDEAARAWERVVKLHPGDQQARRKWQASRSRIVTLSPETNVSGGVAQPLVTADDLTIIPAPDQGAASSGSARSRPSLQHRRPEAPVVQVPPRTRTPVLVPPRQHLLPRMSRSPLQGQPQFPLPAVVTQPRQPVSKKGKPTSSRSRSR